MLLHDVVDIIVAPLVGAWIETVCRGIPHSYRLVAPLVGAWIETVYFGGGCVCQNVAPLVGAWIETSSPILGT